MTIVLTCCVSIQIIGEIRSHKLLQVQGLVHSQPDDHEHNIEEGTKLRSTGRHIQPI